MLEHSWLGEALRAGNTLFSILYWGAAIGLAYFVMSGFKKKFVVPGLVVIALAFGYLPFTIYQETKAREEYAKAAWAHFTKLCTEKAGIKVYKTVKDVESVLITKPRPTVSADERELFDQFWRGDQYGGIERGDDPTIGLVSSLLWDRNRDGGVSASSSTDRGFPRVELKSDINYLVYLADYAEKKIQKTSVKAPSSKYSLDWQDLSTPEDQRFWISASRWWITDIATGQLLGERFGFAIEPGFGLKSGARSPWFASQSERTFCPGPGYRQVDNRFFVKQVLTPIPGK